MKAKMKTLMAAIALGSGLGFASSANASIIDLFSEPGLPAEQVVNDNTIGGVVANQYGIGANILGGYRDLVVDAQFGVVGGSKKASMLVSDGTMSWSNDDGVKSVGKIQWDGGTDAATPELLVTNGLGGTNLVHQTGCPVEGCNTIVALINRADLGFNYDIGIYKDAGNYTILKSGTLFGVSSAYESTYKFDWFGLPTGDYFDDGLPFSIVKVGTGANMENVGAIEFTVYNTGACYQAVVAGLPDTSCKVSVDLDIDSITKVPEPASLALVGLGLFGLAGLRRRKQNA